MYVCMCWFPKKRHEPVQLFIGGYVGQLEIQLTKYANNYRTLNSNYNILRS